MTRRGYKTTEFWTTILALVLVAGSEVFGPGLDRATEILIAVLAGGYNLSRGLAKGNRA